MNDLEDTVVENTATEQNKDLKKKKKVHIKKKKKNLPQNHYQAHTDILSLLFPQMLSPAVQSPHPKRC